MPGTAARGHTRGDPPDSAIRAQLARILDSPVLSRSEQLRRFLSFIVGQTLAGQGHTLKESVLAHELYGRGTDFDGGTDPVVRVDARRLRDKLREYYQDKSDPVVISLPKGSYVPVFEEHAARVHQPTGSVVVEALEERRPRRYLVRERMFVGALAIAAVAVIAAIAWRALHTQTDVTAEVLPLASYPGAEGPPALSPDGTLVAFAWSGDAGPSPTDIYVKAVGSEALRRLTDTPGWESSPAWSPDGESIAFVRDGQGVFTISQLGGSERQVSASGTHVVWGGDSKSVLIRDRAGNAGSFGIQQVFLDTLERRWLTRPDLGPGDWRFEVSPDGNTLAFIRCERQGMADLYVAPMQGGQPRRLTDWSANLTGLSWMPDSREIVYSVQEPAAGRLWRIHANGTSAGRGSPIRDIPAAADNPSISRPMRGRPVRLAFQAVTRDVDLRMMDLNAPQVNDLLESKAFANSTLPESLARFSPDGSRVAFASWRSGSPQIWMAGRDGSELRQITSLDASAVFVGAWSPDGATIAFDAVIGGNDDVYVVGADGGHLRRLSAETSVDGVPSWSGDGRWIYFSSTRAGAIPDVWRVSPDGGPAIRITRNGGFDAKASFDQQYLFYLDRHPAGAAADGAARLMRAPVAGGHEEVVLQHVLPFLWAVTENGIVFITRTADVDAIDVYRFSDQRVSRLGQLGFRISESFRSMTVSRDGRWALATQMVRFDSDLMRIDNFR
jgi:Tol biopolymer transport system component